MNCGFDFSELTEFKKDLMNELKKDLPKDVQKFLDKEKRKLLKEVKKNARTNVKKKKGNYLKSLKAGKTRYNKETGDITTKVYADPKIAPHAHLIEDGHLNVPRGEGKKKGAGCRSGKGGKAVSFTAGKHIFKKSELNFKSEYEKDVNEFLGEYFGNKLK